MSPPQQRKYTNINNKKNLVSLNFIPAGAFHWFQRVGSSLNTPVCRERKRTSRQADDGLSGWFQASTAPWWSKRKVSSWFPGWDVLMHLSRRRWCSSAYYLKCPLTPKPPALSLQRCPRIPDGVYLIAGKVCGGITKPVTLLNYRVEADTAYTAPVSGSDRPSPLFKLRCSKHAVSFQLQPLSSPSPSDCCGEVFFRGYHPPSLWTSLHKYIYTLPST